MKDPKDFALITGGNKGIGEQIAYKLAERNYNLLITGRDNEALEQVQEKIKKHYGVEVVIKRVDLTVTQEYRDLVNFVLKEGFLLSVLVNNAGFGRIGAMSDMKQDEVADLMRVNSFMPVMLTYELLPLIKDSAPSYVLNVSSSAAFFPMPYFNTYASAKRFILNFSLGLKHEVRKDDIHVTCLCPGATETAFFNHPSLHQFYKRSSALIASPEKVADKGLKGMFKKKAIVTPGWVTKFQRFSAAILPEPLKARLAQRVVK